MPPSNGPIAGAMTTTLSTPTAALARSAIGYARNSMALPTGVRRPPLMPCRTRSATSWSSVWAAPHAKEIATKQKTMKLLKEFHKYLAER